MRPVAEVTAAGRGGRVGQRGRYGIDGGFTALAMFAVIEAGLAGTVAWSARHRRPAVAALATVGGTAVAGIGGELPVLHRAGQARDLGAAAARARLRGDEHVLDMGCGRGAVLMLATRLTPASHGRPGQTRTCRQPQASPIARGSAPKRS